MMRFAALAAYAASIPAANWMIGHVGDCVHGAPCVIPVWFGLYAPSGVIMVGVSLVARDAVHSMMGARCALLAIIFGAAVSAELSPTAIVSASVVAFMAAELLDFAVYAPLRKKRLALAVLLSGLVGAMADSAAFLWLAFGSLDLISGQVVGKIYASAVVSVILAIRSRMFR